MTTSKSHPASHFEALYSGRSDPYDLTTRWYEQRKYQLTLAALTQPTYRNALEIDCGEGLFTDQLAPRCAALSAIDASPTATQRARTRLGPRPGLSISDVVVPGDWPEGHFDLIVLSEVGYYLGEDDLSTLAARIADCAPSPTELVAVHWRHRSPTLTSDGDTVHQKLGAALQQWQLHTRHVERDFLLDVWTAT